MEAAVGGAEDSTPGEGITKFGNTSGFPVVVRTEGGVNEIDKEERKIGVLVRPVPR
jgi:hypothetical protein